MISSYSIIISILFTLPLKGKIDREFLQELISEMVKSEKAIWLPSTLVKKSAVLIYWRSPSEWAQIIYKFVDKTGGIGSIFTVYDLTEGDDTIREGTYLIFAYYFLKFYFSGFDFVSPSL